MNIWFWNAETLSESVSSKQCYNLICGSGDDSLFLAFVGISLVPGGSDDSPFIVLVELWLKLCDGGIDTSYFIFCVV